VSYERTRAVVADFCVLHAQDPTNATLFLASLFCACYSILSPQERSTTLSGVMGVIAKIGLERFEDGPDFAQFLKDHL
jgi:hypothetical protein